MNRAWMVVVMVAACGGVSIRAPVPHAADGTCPAPSRMFGPGCGAAPADALVIEDGCYVACDDGERCPSGTSCTRVWIDPCESTSASTESPRCRACGGEARLCLTNQ